MVMLCQHKSWTEGGIDHPPGRYCSSCGAKIVRRGSKVDQLLDANAREQRAAQQFEKVRRELALKTRRT